MNKELSEKLKKLPSVEEVLLWIDGNLPSLATYSRKYIAYEIRRELEYLRKLIKDNQITEDVPRESYIKIVAGRTGDNILERENPVLRKIINGTGVILHTGLGRAPLPAAAVKNIQEVLYGYSLLEFNIKTGKRGKRQSIISPILCALFDCEDAVVVNNNAAAVYLVLNSLAEGKETIVSRGQQVEIGGSFRMPDIMNKSHTNMIEVGTTNKTHLKDYENAISKNTGMILNVHTSNYRVSGFVENVPLKELVRLGKKHNVPVAYDIGSGVLNDFTPFGLSPEPTVSESLQTGIDVIMFSGDKVFGGPQCGIILGKSKIIKKVQENPVMRVVRCDKMTLAALEGTLKVYLKKQSLWEKIPVYKMMTEPAAGIKNKVEELSKRISPEIREKFNVREEELESQIGSGAFPVEKIPGFGLCFFSNDIDVEKIASYFRGLNPPIIGYINREKFYLNFRTINRMDAQTVLKAINRMFDAGNE